MSMENIYREIEALLRDGRSAVLGTIVKQAGPSPRGMGTKFLIRKDGSFSGTIGGGLLEARSLEEASKVFETSLPVLLRFALTGTDVAETDMLCGGNVEVFLEPISPEKPGALEVYEKAAETGGRGGEGLLATALDAEAWAEGRFPVALLEKSGQKTGALPGGGGAEAALTESMDRILGAKQPVVVSHVDDAGLPLRMYVEPVASESVLYVFGGGHVSRQIVPLAHLVGFEVEVVDDRAEFAAAANFPEARAVREMPFQGVTDQLPVNASSFLVIVTRGHMHDKIVLEQALRTDAQYIGMIGSRRKRTLIYEKLLEEGFSEKDLARVHSPIGLDIGAETPEEIAVSIVAELIQARAEGR